MFVARGKGVAFPEPRYEMYEEEPEELNEHFSFNYLRALDFKEQFMITFSSFSSFSVKIQVVK